MNQHTDFTPPRGPDCPTAWSLGFDLLLDAHRDHLEAERDMEHVQGCQDPSVSLWDRDRQRAELRLRTRILRLLDLPVVLPEDRPLQRATILICRMLDRDDPALPRQLHREMMGCFRRDYQVPGFGPIARLRNSLLIQARHQIDAMIRLPFYDYLPDVGGADDDNPDAFLAPDF